MLPGLWMGMPEPMLALSGFFLNFFWEMVQSPLYSDIYTKTYMQILTSRLHCTLGDVLILLGAYWIIAWMVRDRYWMIRLRVRDVAGFTLLGLGYTIVSEWINVDIRSAWGYGATMPRVFLIGTGLAHAHAIGSRYAHTPWIVRLCALSDLRRWNGHIGWAGPVEADHRVCAGLRTLPRVVGGSGPSGRN